MFRSFVAGLCVAACSAAEADVLTLPAGQRPPWVQEDGIVMAGSWEALPIRARIFGPHPYAPTPEQQAAYEAEHSPQMIDRLKQLGVNFVMIHCYRGAGLEAERQSMADAARFAKRYREAGLRVGVYNYSGTLFWDRFFQEAPQAKDWLVLSADGKPIPYGPQTFRYYWNRNHPDAQAHHQKIVRFAVEEIKADLIHFDNYSVGPGYDACSRRLFRDYVRATFAPAQLAEMKLAGFDAAQPPRADSPELLKRAWQDFSCRAVAESYRDMCRYARSLRKDVLVELNPGGVGSRIHPPLDHGRLLTGGEAFWDESGKSGYRGGQLISRIRTYKVGRRMNNITFAYTTAPLEMAESMAFNRDCLGCICWYEYARIVDRPYSARAMSPDLAPFVRFFHRRRDLLRQAEVVADVAVLRSFPSQVFADAKHGQATYRAEQALIDSGVPFQIVYDRHLTDLGRYRTLVLAGCTAMAENQLDAIRRYAGRGGRVCIFGPAATHDEWLKPRVRPGLDDLPAAAVVRMDENADPLSAVRQSCGGEFSLAIAVKPTKEHVAARLLAIGQRVYSDRDYVFRKIPKELLGLPRIRFPVEQAKTDSALRFQARVPVRVYVAFARRGFSAAWLDPQPGWQLYRAGALGSTIVQIGEGMDIYFRDFDAGPVRLFEGNRGAYVLLGIQPNSPQAPKETFVEEAAGSSLGGLCAELTEQPHRRLVHLVNYREGVPFRDLAVSVGVPPGRHVKTVTLASPEHPQDIPVPHDQRGDRVGFTVPRVGVYEIAIVDLSK